MADAPSARTTYGGGQTSTITQGFAQRRSPLEAFLTDRLQEYQQSPQPRAVAAPRPAVNAGMPRPNQITPVDHAAREDADRARAMRQQWERIAMQGPSGKLNYMGMVQKDPDSVRRYNLALAMLGTPSAPDQVAAQNAAGSLGTWGATAPSQGSSIQDFAREAMGILGPMQGMQTTGSGAFSRTPYDPNARPGINIQG